MTLTLTLVASALLAQSPPDSFQDRLEYHVHAKAELAATVPAAELPARFAARGFRLGNVDREDVALYVDRRLDTSERAELEARGIAFTGPWIPPVEGRHPHGFHVVTVPHARLAELRAHPRAIRLEATEIPMWPAGDVAAEVMDLAWLQGGKCGPGFDGSGVRVAVADSGFDLTHPDLPAPFEAYDLTIGFGPGTWGTSVANTVIAHGTHVLGALAGNGVMSGGKYRGVAPGVDLALYKIGNSIDGGTTVATMIAAIHRAQSIGCRVLNMSYIGWGDYMDGSGSLCQAIDFAREVGMLTFVCAGNQADKYNHGQVDVPAAGSATTSWIANNTSGAWGAGAWLEFMLVWRDDAPLDLDLSFGIDNLGAGEHLVPMFQGTSPRGTEMRLYLAFLKPNAGQTKTYTLRVVDSSVAGGAVTTAHVYDRYNFGGFATLAPWVTVQDPAIADGAVAVGSFTHRKDWIDATGAPQGFPVLVEGTVSPFSSRGPRIDGAQKPELVAPGAVRISTRDAGFDHHVPYLIDDDGVFGVGTASYRVTWGTSFAAPAAAGLAALLWQADPLLSADDVVHALQSTTSIGPATGAGPHASFGAGVPDAWAALHAIGASPCPALVTSTPNVSVANGGDVELWLNRGPAFDGHIYFALGSASGSAPGFPFGAVHVPLAIPDFWFDLSLAHPNSALFQDTLGVLVDQGRGTARISFPANMPAGLVGRTFHHAYVTFVDLGAFGLWTTSASNAEPLLFVP